MSEKIANRDSLRRLARSRAFRETARRRAARTRRWRPWDGVIAPACVPQEIRYGPEPATGQQALDLRDRPLTATLRVFMANRGVWEALPGAGPTMAVPARETDVDLYLDRYASFLRAVTG